MKAVSYRELSYAGFIIWGLVIFFFAYWKIAKRYLLKKPIEIPEEIGLEKKEEFLAKQRKIYGKASRGLRLILCFSGFSLAADSVILSLLASLDSTGSQHLILPSIILATSLIPAFFLLMLLSAFTNDYLKRLNENECVIKPASKEDEGSLWLINLLPLLALVLFYQGKIDLLNNLGYGTGLALTIIVLSLVFFAWKEPLGLGVNVILLGLVFTSYLAPSMDRGNGTSFALGAWSFISACALQIFPLLCIAMGAAQLAKYPLIKRMGVLSPELPKIVLQYLTIPFGVALLTPIIGFALQWKKIVPYSLTVVSLQVLAWLAVLISLAMADRLGKAVVVARKDDFIKERKYRLPFDRTFLRLVMLAVLLLSAAFETYRGLWLFFGLSAAWVSLMFLSLWRVWKWAFPE